MEGRTRRTHERRRQVGKSGGPGPPFRWALSPPLEMRGLWRSSISSCVLFGAPRTPLRRSPVYSCPSCLDSLCSVRHGLLAADQQEVSIRRKRTRLDDGVKGPSRWISFVRILRTETPLSGLSTDSLRCFNRRRGHGDKFCHHFENCNTLFWGGGWTDNDRRCGWGEGLSDVASVVWS